MNITIAMIFVLALIICASSIFLWTRVVFKDNKAATAALAIFFADFAIAFMLVALCQQLAMK